MVKKSNGWNLQEMQETLVKDTEQRISDGFQEIANDQGGEKHQPSDIIHHTSAIEHQTSSIEHHTSAIEHHTSAIEHQTSEKESTKGVQTYIPMSMYRRLNDIKLTRRENIAALVAQAIELWLDVQEGKQKVEKVI